MTPDRPLADAQRRLGKPGRPRKTAPDGHTTGTPPAQTRMDSGRVHGAEAPQAAALSPRLLDRGDAVGSSSRSSASASQPLRNQNPAGPRLVNVSGAAAYLGVSVWTVRDLHACGALRRVQLPLSGGRELRRLLFDRHDLDRLIEAAKD